MFGVSWKTHILHSSFINGLIAVGTFFVLRNLNLNKSYSLLYSLSFAILAYPVSGTPFVDHHAAFLCLFGIYCFILALNDKGNIYLILTPIFFGLSFISKQTPSAYIIIPFGVMIILYSILNKNFKFIAYPFLGSLIFLITIALIGKIQGISFDDFLVQYIFHPQTIGSSRLDNINFSFSGLIGKYKFIYILLILLSYINVKNLIANKKYAKDKNFYIYLSILFYSLGLVLHQILTKNQIFIYFILPLLFAFMTIYLKDITKKYKTTILLAIFFFSFFLTAKYHLRFNETRKFHELNNVNFNLSKEAYLIDERLSNLKWITPVYKDNPENEIDFLKYTLRILKEDKRKKMVMTHYLFFSSLLGEKLHAPSRTFSMDGVSFPIKGDKYYPNYKKHISQIIQNNKIKVIYVISEDVLEDEIVYDYLDKKCINEHSFSDLFKKYELNKC